MYWAAYSAIKVGCTLCGRFLHSVTTVCDGARRGDGSDKGANEHSTYGKKMPNEPTVGGIGGGRSVADR